MALKKVLAPFTSDRLRLMALPSLFGCAIALTTAAEAQLPFPRLDTSFPLGAEAGSEVEVTLTGGDLDELTGLIFDKPGLSATKVDAFKFRIAAAPDSPLGLYEFRAVGKFGVSTPRPFVVGKVAEIIDPGTNHAVESAVTLTTPCVLHGRAEPEQRDTYRFSASKGQVLHISCAAFALDSPMDPTVTVSDAAGKTLARGDDERDRDVQFTFIAPVDGDYLLSVNDKLFGGGAAHAYRLELSAEPVEMPLRLPASAAELTGGKPTEEIEPNDHAAKAQPIELPALVNGKLDSDYFQFQAEAGRALWLEVSAERDGTASDAVLIVTKITRDAQGSEQVKQVLELDDQPEPPPGRWLLGSRDPAGLFKPDETATYRVRVVDRFASGGRYRLLVRDASPDFSLVALADSPANEEKKLFTWQPNARRGGGTIFPVAAQRRGYDGEITFRAAELPKGMTVTGGIPAGAAVGWLVFRATADAEPWAGFPRVIGEGGGVARDVHAITYRWNVENRDNQRLAAHLATLAVGIIPESAPLSICPTEQKTREAPLGATLEIPLKITRFGQPKGEWQITPVGLPGLVKFEPLKLDGATATEAKLVLSLQNKDGNNFTAGTYTFALRARGTVAYQADEKAKPKDVPHVEVSAPITVTLTAPDTATQ